MSIGADVWGHNDGHCDAGEAQLLMLNLIRQWRSRERYIGTGGGQREGGLDQLAMGNPGRNCFH